MKKKRGALLRTSVSINLDDWDMGSWAIEAEELITVEADGYEFVVKLDKGKLADRLTRHILKEAMEEFLTNCVFRPRAHGIECSGDGTLEKPILVQWDDFVYDRATIEQWRKVLDSKEKEIENEENSEN